MSGNCTAARFIIIEINRNSWRRKKEGSGETVGKVSKEASEFTLSREFTVEGVLNVEDVITLGGLKCQKFINSWKMLK